MTTALMTRGLAAVGATLALAVPTVAQAHDHNHHHGYGRFGAPCRALEAGRTPKWLTTDQAAALKDACIARDNALKAANDKFKADTADARATYTAAVAPAKANLKSAWQSLRDACKADRHSQQCADARAAYKAAWLNARTTFRDAWRAYITATRPAAQARSTAVHNAQKAFRDAVAKALA
jgi:hypothetical protein